MTSEHDVGPQPADPPAAPADSAAEPTPPAPAAEQHRLHPAATAIEALRTVRSIVAAMIVVLISAGALIGSLIILGLLVASAIFAFVQWRVTTYAVVDGTLQYRSGVFARKERNVPASRISALDTQRGILQRIFGVVAVKVQTAGGAGDAEITLRAVTFPEAERLRHELGHRATGVVTQTEAAAAGSTDAAPGAPGAEEAAPGAAPSGQAGSAPAFTSSSRLLDDAPVVYAITPRELLVAALTSPSIAVVGAAIAAAGSLGQDALPDSTQRQLASSVEELTVTAALVLLVLGLLATIVISVAGTILLYGGFRITRDDRRLRIRRGILTERTGTIPRDRIHGVRIVESPLRQALGYAAIEVEVAGYAEQDEVTRTLVPIIRRDAIPAFLPTVVPGLDWPQRPLEPVPARARRRYLTVPLLWAAPVAIAALVAPIGLFRVVAILPVAVAILIGVTQARAAGWSLDGRTLALRWRGLSRVTLLAESPRLQQMALSVSPFQRRAALGTFSVKLSNRRTGRVRHLDEPVVAELLRDTGR